MQTVAETVYRHVIVPAVRRGATIMDRAFNAEDTTGNGSEYGATPRPEVT
jgi:hypothetical protein